MKLNKSEVRGEGRVWLGQPLAVIWGLKERELSRRNWVFFILKRDGRGSTMDRKIHLEKEGWAEDLTPYLSFSVKPVGEFLGEAG